MIFLKKKNKRILYSADYVYLNGSHKRKHSVLTENGKIIETGKREIIKEQFPFAKEIKFEGAIYPGFIDSHVHLNDLAKILAGTDGRNLASLKELNRVIENSKDEEIRIFNFDFNSLTDKEWEDLFFKSKKPVLITSKDEHSAFINDKLIKKYNLEIKDANGGIIKRVNNKFAGILKDNALKNIRHLIEAPASKENIEKAINYLLSMGITGITNFDFALFDTLKKLDEESNLKLRIFQGIKCEYMEEAIRQNLKSGKGSKFFRIGPVKCFLDGSLGSQTALMNESVGFEGIQTLKTEEFEKAVKMANENELQVAVHAIGSKAVDIALNTFLRFGNSKMRNRIEHMQFISENRLSLLENTEFIASMQPAHYKYDKNLLEKYGLKNYEHAYDWKFLLSLNKTVAFGSDAPVVNPDIAEGIYTAVFREKKGKNLSLKEAIKCYTENGARANFYEKEGGRIIGNMNADFTVLNKPLTEDFDSKRIETVATIIKGETVWEK